MAAMKPIMPGWPSDLQLGDFHERHFGEAIKLQFLRALNGETVPVIHPASKHPGQEDFDCRTSKRVKTATHTASDSVSSLCTRCKTYMSYAMWHQHQTSDTSDDATRVPETNQNPHTESTNEMVENDQTGLRIELTDELVAIFNHSQAYRKQRE